MSTDIISGILAPLVFAVGGYLLVRNCLVCRFYLACIEAAFDVVFVFLDSLETDYELFLRSDEYVALERLRENVCSKSYIRMLFSFKPLKLRYWFTPEETEFLKKGGME